MSNKIRIANLEAENQTRIDEIDVLHKRCNHVRDFLKAQFPEIFKQAQEELDKENEDGKNF